MKRFGMILAVLMALCFSVSTTFAAATSDQVGSYSLFQPLTGGAATVAVDFEAAAAQNTLLGALGTIEMVRVPPNCTVTDVILTTDDLDSGTTLTLDVGYGTNDDYFIAASTVGQAGGIVRASASTALPLAFTASDTIDVKVKALGTTTVGTIWLTVMYIYTP